MSKALLLVIHRENVLPFPLFFHLIMLLGTSAKIVDSKMCFRVLICFVESKANTAFYQNA